jgi:glycerophosphoryl diester phosphodiesterase
MLCIGHRGAMGHAPENTLASFQKALELGTPCVELDVYPVDGHLMVFHDDRLERTTNGSGYLSEQKFTYLRSLDAGAGERIPILEEVFEVIGMRAGVNIELKGEAAARPVVELISAFRKRGWSDNLILVSSFSRRDLSEVHRMDAEIKLGVLIPSSPSDDVLFAARLGAYSVHPSQEFVDRRFVRDARSRGLRVFVFTVNQPDDISAMEELGVDGVFTDYPERVLKDHRPGETAIGWP